MDIVQKAGNWINLRAINWKEEFAAYTIFYFKGTKKNTVDYANTSKENRTE
jgi:hypothetical protein